MKKLLILFFIFISTNCYAVTDFNVSVKDSGGDYTTIANAEGAFDVNLTDAIVLSHGGITGTMADGGTATGQNSGATGTIAHVTSTQIMIYGLTGVFENAEDICSDSPTCSNKVTSSTVPDDAALVITFYNDISAFVNWDGGTYDAVNTVTVQGDTSGLLEGSWDGTVSGGVLVTANGFASCGAISDPYVTFQNYVCDSDGNAAALVVNDNIVPAYLKNIIVKDGGVNFGGGAPSAAINVVSINSSGHGFSRKSGWSTTAPNYGSFYNCVSINAADDGFSSGCATNQSWGAYNSVSFGAANEDFDTGCQVASSSYNASGDTTATDQCTTGCIISLTMATELVDGANGNVHLNTGSNLIDFGNDYSATTGVNYDIDIVTRTGSWDIGADEFVAETPPETPNSGDITTLRNITFKGITIR